LCIADSLIWLRGPLNLRLSHRVAYIACYCRTNLIVQQLALPHGTREPAEDKPQGVMLAHPSSSDVSNLAKLL
jgi:hypothetical protein